MTYTATYSPEDNKLRLYASSRLDPEAYARVKAAGFIWAPKQELFVAPMWTPSRADLCIELAGEIDDEDTSLIDRSEQRAERFEDYADRRKQDADHAHKAVSAIADNIPFGQPILVGHHSEKHARKDAEKIQNGMRKAVKCWEESQYWTARAHGAIRAAKYKERPDVRARRIKGLEADERKQQKERDFAAHLLALWEGDLQKLKAKDGTESTFTARALWLLNGYDHGAVDCGDGKDYWSGWSALNDGKITAEQIKAQRLETLPRSIAHFDRWLTHIRNRLAYERAMLAEDGGTIADKTAPEVGGACRCWASPGYGKGWSYIRKVNKVSVTLENNWGNGGKNFTRTMPFDKLSAIMTKTQVDEARAAGKLQEAKEGTGFYLMQSREDFDKATPPEPESDPPDTVCPDGPACPDPVCQAERTAQGLPVVSFEAMRETLKAGVKVVVAPNLFPTPPDVARRMVYLAKLHKYPALRILEPSAGTGNILEELRPWVGAAEIVAAEINLSLTDALRDRFREGIAFQCCDFLGQGESWGKFDRILMNPPFDHGEDLKHIRHALTMLKPGGVLVGICGAGSRQVDELKPQAEACGGHWEELPAGTFTGTNVRSILFSIEKPPPVAPTCTQSKQLSLLPV